MIVVKLIETWVFYCTYPDRRIKIFFLDGSYSKQKFITLSHLSPVQYFLPFRKGLNSLIWLRKVSSSFSLVILASWPSLHLWLAVFNLSPLHFKQLGVYITDVWSSISTEWATKILISKGFGPFQLTLRGKYTSNLHDLSVRHWHCCELLT